jgi:hypothetical protein
LQWGNWDTEDLHFHQSIFDQIPLKILENSCNLAEEILDNIVHLLLALPLHKYKSFLISIAFCQ